jgi:endonuclease/exonuclease/phosphatase family metal-dependent hydrolase
MQPHRKKAGLRLRTMTYNIHSCIGTDKKVNPERIAGVIADSAADIVALQEVDNGIARTHYQNQTKRLAEMLNMEAVFFPVVRSGSQKYGLAVMSRFECIDVHYGWLPTLYPKLKLDLQKRGCIRTTLQTPGGPILVFNTHLGLYRLERRRQIHALLGDDWLAALPPESAIIFCADLNAGPFSSVYLRLSRLLVDVQKGLKPPARSKPTFPSRRPLFRIDHMFVSQHFKILSVQVPRTRGTRLASDHLPILADLEYVPSPVTSQPKTNAGLSGIDDILEEKTNSDPLSASKGSAVN